MGADPDPAKRKNRTQGGMFSNIMDAMVRCLVVPATPVRGCAVVPDLYKTHFQVAGIKSSIDVDGNGKLTKAEFHRLLHPEV